MFEQFNGDLIWKFRSCSSERVVVKEEIGDQVRECAKKSSDDVLIAFSDCTNYMRRRGWNGNQLRCRLQLHSHAAQRMDFRYYLLLLEVHLKVVQF